MGQLSMRSFADVSMSEGWDKVDRRTGEFEETPPIVTVRMDAVDGEDADTIELRAEAQDLLKFEADVADSEEVMTVSSKLEGQNGDMLEELMTMGGRMPKTGTTMSGTMNINAGGESVLAIDVSGTNGFIPMKDRSGGEAARLAASISEGDAGLTA